MKLFSKISPRYRKIGIGLIGVILLFVAVTTALGLTKEDVLDFVFVFLKPYFFLLEFLANKVIGSLTSGVYLAEHRIVFENYLGYYEKYQDIIDNWPSFLLFLKWSVFIFISIWVFGRSVKKKLLYTFLLILTHFFAVFSGLVLIAGIGPLLIEPSSLTELKPHTPGALAMFGLFVCWLNRNLEEIKTVLKEFGVKTFLSDKKKKEIIWIVFIFMLLKNFLVPYFNYYWYINILLTATRELAAILGYSSDISGPYLVGPMGGTLFMAKWCLGFITIYVFSSLVFLTRKNLTTAWMYILSGIVFLHIVNIIRLAVLFIYVQHHFDSRMISNHHEIYNIVVYALIFLMWVLWFEKFLNKGQRSRLADEADESKPLI